MTLLAGETVLALGGMRDRPLARLLASLGAEVRDDIASLSVASFLIDDLGVNGVAALGWPRARLEEEHPQLIHVSVTPFGSYGPRAGWRGSELVASAVGGTLRLTGDPDRPPVKEALDACAFHAEMVAAAGAMAAHYARGGGSPGQHVDVSVQEVAFSRNVNGLLVWQFDRRKLARTGGALNYGRATVRCIWRLADGWCFHSLMSGRFGAPANGALAQWMDDTGMQDNPLSGVDWLSYDRASLDPATRAIWEGALATFFGQRSRAEIAVEGRRRGINACVVAEPADVLEDPHLVARGFWDEDEEGRRKPGRFALLRDGDDAPPRPVPPGQRPGPLSGLRVLDFSWALVGSITTKTLGDLGADVIKVESRSRPCLSRLDVQVTASSASSLDDKPWFAHLNSSKRSLCLDLKRLESRELMEPLLEWADVVVENFSPGTMAKLGLDYESLSARHPGLVMVSGSVYGQSGPLAREWGVDGTGGALSGRTFLTGWPDRDPVIPGAVPYGDVIVPYVMAAFAAAAASRRRSAGRGGHVDASMYEICVQQMSAAIARACDGERPQRTGNDDDGVVLQGVFPTIGDDRWVAITLHDADELAKLHALAGGTEVAAWTRQWRDHELAEHLQHNGIAAGVVQDIEDAVERDPQLLARGVLIELEHPKLGPFGHMRTPLDFSRDRPAPYRAPGIGEHSVEIARDLAGMDDDRINRLIDAGVLS